jgi:DNA polymerase
MFVGEAPGFYEDQQGVPFIGAAGKLLTKLLESVGLSREDIYIANVVKCRPPNNRDPQPDEINTCKPFLLQQIQIIKPKLVCSLGNFATHVLLGRKVGITKVRGQTFHLPEFILFPLLHPAAALHQGNLLVPLREDFQKLKGVLESMNSTNQSPGQDEIVTTAETTQEPLQSPPSPTQMDLF